MSTQTDLKIGQVPHLCGENLAGKEGLLGKLANTGVLLPTAITDITPYVVIAGEAQGEHGQFQPFTGERQHRVRVNGAGAKGAQLVLADPGTPADKGKLRPLPADAGTYRVIAIAEEDFVDEQLVKVRPVPVGNVVVN